MTTEEMIKLPAGTKVYHIEDAKITAFLIFTHHPKHPDYFYLIHSSSVNSVKVLYLKSNAFLKYIWETDYEKAKEIMWEQLKQKVITTNAIYMNDSKSINFEDGESTSNS